MARKSGWETELASSELGQRLIRRTRQSRIWDGQDEARLPYMVWLKQDGGTG